MKALRLILLLALLLAPVGRLGMADARAVPAAGSGHCDPMPGHGDDQPAQDDEALDCAIACAAALAALPASVAAPSRPTRIVALRPRPQAVPGGLHPDAELPPPRRS